VKPFTTKKEGSRAVYTSKDEVRDDAHMLHQLLSPAKPAYDSIEVNSCDEVVRLFTELLKSNDMDGAMGVAQVLWVLCSSQMQFSATIDQLCDAVICVCDRMFIFPVEVTRGLIFELSALYFRPEDSGRLNTPFATIV
jgi:hypothetical protein